MRRALLSTLAGWIHTELIQIPSEYLTRSRRGFSKVPPTGAQLARANGLGDSSWLVLDL